MCNTSEIVYLVECVVDLVCKPNLHFILRFSNVSVIIKFVKLVVMVTNVEMTADLYIFP